MNLKTNILRDNYNCKLPHKELSPKKLEQVVREFLHFILQLESEHLWKLEDLLLNTKNGQNPRSLKQHRSQN